MTIKIDRMWINQPSTQQPLHTLHGKNVLAVKESENMWGLVFIEGYTHYKKS